MTISFPLALPSARIASCELAMMSAVAVGESPFTFDAQVQSHPGQRWGLSLTLPVMRRAEVQPWLAFLAALNGREGTFLAGDPYHKFPLGAATGTPLVDGGAQAAMSQVLSTKGWSAGVTGILKAGDFIQLGSGATARLHMVTVDADSDGAGKAVLDIWPSLRSTPADGAAIVTENAQGVFKLRSNQRVSARTLVTYKNTIEAAEFI